MTTLVLAEAILASGDADLVGMVRAHIADPELMPKSRAGQAVAVRPCIGANVCINGLLDHKPLSCMANPDVGRKGDGPPAAWGAGRTAFVVGAGPAGLEAARRLALGGWSVTLAERDMRLGGQMARWSATPSREEFFRLVEWWETEIARLAITVRKGEAIAADALIARAPDLVVVATGSETVATPVPQRGHDLVQVGPYDPVQEGGHVLVRDEMGRLAALLTAERLSLAAQRVTLVTSLLHPGEGDGLTTVYPLIRDLAARGIVLIDRARVSAVDGRSVRIEGVFGEVRPPIEDVDAIVSLIDARSVDGLAAPLGAAGLATLVVGDAHLPHDVAGALAHAARSIDALAATFGVVTKHDAPEPA